MARTTAALVEGVLVNDYGPDYKGNYPDLTPYIDIASSIVDDVVSCAMEEDRGSVGISNAKAELIERWLAAHTYTQMDQTYASTSTEGGNASFHGQTGKGFEGSKYGLMALRLDYTGCLEIIDKRKFALAIWMGKPPSAQTPVDQRD